MCYDMWLDKPESQVFLVKSLFFIFSQNEICEFLFKLPLRQFLRLHNLIFFFFSFCLFWFFLRYITDDLIYTHVVPS